MSAPVIRGLRHLALRVIDIRRSRAFYENLLGMRVVWQPDPDHVYLTSGTDNLALHQMSPDQTGKPAKGSERFMDHFGFVVDSPREVDRMFQWMEGSGVTIVKPPRRHRDGSYSFYLADPDENTIQVLYEPTISAMEFVSRAGSRSAPVSETATE